MKCSAMKILHFYFRILSFVVSLILVSCMSRNVIGLEFDSDDVLVLHAVASPQEPLHAMITITDNVLSSMYDKLYHYLRPYSENAVVAAYVNGSEEPIHFITRYNPEDADTDLYRGYYESDFVPQEGDEITIVAHFPGYPPIKATQKVPVKPDFDLSSDIEIISDYRALVTLHFTIKDTPGEDNYYRFVWPSNREHRNEELVVRRDISHFSDKYEYGNFDGSYKTISYSTEVNLSNQEGEGKILTDIFQCISYDTYKFLESWQTPSSGIFGEVSKVHSNVEGGAGIFAAVSGVRVRIPIN